MEVISNILYIHGLSSSGNSHTAKCLRELLTDCRVLAPDIPVHPMEALELLHQLCHEEKVDVVVGTSMGGMYAQQMYGLPRIIVNPGFHVSELLIKEMGNEESIRLPFFSQRQDGATDFEVDAQLIREFQEMEARQFEGVATDPTPQELIYALFGYQDEVVNCEEEYRLRCRGVIEHFNGGHRLNEDVIRSHIIPLILQLLD